MSGKDKDGGAAFPVPEDANMNEQEGLSKRDWFAGQALAGAMVGDAEGVASHAKMAEYCFRQADAMLAERAKERP